MNFNIGEAEENRVRSSLRTRPDLFQNGTRCSCDPTSILKVVFGRGSAALFLGKSGERHVEVFFRTTFSWSQ